MYSAPSSVLSRRGFTLIELMITVAIVGILAAIAIPTFNQMQLRAKRAEGPINLQAIRTAQRAYHAEWDTYTGVFSTPRVTEIGRTPTEFAGGGYDRFQLLGWTADGDVYGSYYCQMSLSTQPCVANLNVDGDETLQQFYVPLTRNESVRMLRPNNVY